MRHFRIRPVLTAFVAVLSTAGVYGQSGQSQPPPAPATPAATTDHHAVPRDSWQRIPEIVSALGITAGSVVADIGAGEGYFSTRFAAIVGAEGRVFAVDINDSSIVRLQRRIERDGLTNIVAILGTPTDPKLPAGTLDAAFIINAYHEMTQARTMLAAIRTALKPQGRLVIVEPISDAYRSRTRIDQEDRHEIAPAFVQQDAVEAGFVVSRLEDPFTKRPSGTPEYLLVLTPAARVVW